MENRYSAGLVLGLLFMSVLVCTSCTREEFPELKKEYDNTKLQFQEPTITESTKNGPSNASIMVYLNPSTAWYKNGPAFKPTVSMPLLVYASIILPEEKNEWVSMELYCGNIQSGLRYIAGTRSSSDKTSVDYRQTAITWSGYAGNEYYVKISCAYGSCWLPKMVLGQGYAMTIPGTPITVFTGITVP